MVSAAHSRVVLGSISGKENWMAGTALELWGLRGTALLCPCLLCCLQLRLLTEKVKMRAGRLQSSRQPAALPPRWRREQTRSASRGNTDLCCSFSSLPPVPREKKMVNVILHQIGLWGAERQFWGNVSQPTFNWDVDIYCCSDPGL